MDKNIGATRLGTLELSKTQIQFMIKIWQTDNFFVVADIYSFTNL